MLQHGLETFTPAHDLDAGQLFALLEHVPAGRVTIVLQHRIATFHTEHCVYAHLLGHGRDHRTCGRPCERHAVSLGDHRGREHAVLVDAGCRNTVFDAEPQSAALLVPRLVGTGVRRFRIELVREMRAETEAILGAYADLLAGRAAPGDVVSRLGVRAHQGVSAAPMTLLV